MTDKTPASALSRRTALAVLAAGAATAVASPAFAVGAIKHYIIIDLKPGMDMLALDRWYMTFHAPQVRRAFKAWQRNYVSYRSYAVTEEARKLGVLNGRMTEIQFDSLEDFRESGPTTSTATCDPSRRRRTDGPARSSRRPPRRSRSIRRPSSCRRRPRRRRRPICGGSSCSAIRPGSRRTRATPGSGPSMRRRSPDCPG